MDTNTPKGTKDFVGLEAEVLNKIISSLSATAKKESYAYIETPVFDSTSLFLRGVGEGSDVVRKEMYTFLDKGERSLTLRPELTAPVIRALVNSRVEFTKPLPIKVYYHGTAYRYERPQKGRYREFRQFGIEEIGNPNQYDVIQAIKLAIRMLTNLLGSSKYFEVRINHLGSTQSKENYLLALKNFLQDKIQMMCSDCQDRYLKNPLRILDCKVKEDQEILKKAPKINDFLLEEEKAALELTRELLSQEVKVIVDPSLVRGLDYYANIVFELYLKKEYLDFPALGGGGFYPRLYQELGGIQNLAGIGFAFGIERLLEVYLTLIKPNETEIDFVVLSTEQAANQLTMEIFDLLVKEKSLILDLDLSDKKLDKKLTRAVKLAARKVIIVGLDALKTIGVKDLKTGLQQNLSFDQKAITKLIKTIIKG